MAHTLISRKKADVNMTEGNVARHLIMFAIPLILGNLFQQLYNTVDAWVVGNYVSNEAFSAVGSVTPIVNMLIGFFTGLASGATVVISQYYGANQEENVRKAVHTSIVVTLILCVIFTAVGVWMSPHMLRMMKTPDEVFPEASLYLTIYFAGVSGLLIYNMGSAILRAVGDSTRPCYFLVVTALVNTVLDLVFVLVFHMGVEGVALATILAQFISAALVLLALARSKNCVCLRLRWLRLDIQIAAKIFKIGFPAALQMAIVSFSNVFVQSYINHFGADCMGGWTAYHKVDQVIMLPMQSIGLAATTFVGQNLGCGNIKRAKKGVNTALALAVGLTMCSGALVMIAARPLVAFFNDKQEVVEFGVLFLRTISPMYVFPCFNVVLTAVQRGAGNSRVPMIISILSFVVFRQVYLYVVATFVSNTIVPIALGYPAGWLVACVASLAYYLKVGLGKKSVVTGK